MANGSSKMHVLIIGAGLGGLTLAQCLRKHGISFEIFEKDVSATGRSQGWAITLHSMLEDIQRAVPWDMPDFRSSTNNMTPLSLNPQMCFYITNADHKRLGVEAGEDCHIHRVNRGKLRKWLSHEIPVQYGKRLVGVEQTHTNRVAATFEDGTQAVGDVLVGADGVNSVVREHVLKIPNHAVLRTAPVAIIIGETEVSGKAFQRQLQLGHSAYVAGSPNACWLFVGLSQVRPDGKSAQYFWILSWNDADTGKPGHWLGTASREDKLEMAKKKVQSLSREFQEIVHTTEVTGIRDEKFTFRDAEICELPKSHVTLLGDAAHPMAPFMGEGGVQAMRDAMLLSETLRSVDVRDAFSVREALGAYQDELVQRGTEIVRKSQGGQRQNGRGGSAVVTWGHQAKPLPEEKIVLRDGDACKQLKHEARSELPRV